MRRILVLVMVVEACALPACGGKSETADTGEAPFVPSLATGGCGSEAWAWAPLDRMGEIVAWEAMDAFSLSAEIIDGLLAMKGIKALSPIPFGVRSWRLRYLTQDRGELVESTMMLVAPDLGDGSAFPLLLFGHGTTGFTDACAPSGGGLDAWAFPMLFAAQGFVVAAPDYLGMNGFGEDAGFLHPYLVPEATAVASLDAARAALRFEDVVDVGVNADPSRTVLWGGSEGGFAALWADRYVENYAPELDVVATVALVPPTVLTAMGLYALEHPESSTAFALIAAFIAHHDWYAPEPGLDLVLSDAPPRSVASRLPGEMALSCDDFPSVEGVESAEELYSETLLAAGLAGDLSAIAPYDCFLGLADLPTTAVPRGHDAPVLVQLSEADDLVISDVVRPTIPELCAQGYDIEHLECAGAGHTEGAVSSIPYQLDWIRARLAGDPLDPASTCVIREPVDCSVYLDP